MNEAESKRLDKAAGIGCVLFLIGIFLATITGCYTIALKIKGEIHLQLLTTALIVLGVLTIFGLIMFICAIFAQDIVLD
jgi:drug/metabolite transporter superfamily protein YnfA